MSRPTNHLRSIAASWSWLPAIVVCLALISYTPAREPETAAPSLERAFGEQAVAVLKKLKDKGVKNVGVLKFEVQKGPKANPSSNVGPLNMILTDMLERALIVKNKIKDPVGIVQEASAVAAKLPGANHQKAGEGRKRLFEADYPLAWDNGRKVKADAFVYGTACLDPARKNMSVKLCLLDKSMIEKEGHLRIAMFQASSDGSTFADAGETFALRSAFSSHTKKAGETEIATSHKLDYQEEIAKSIKDTYTGAAPHPYKDHTCPVILEAYYGGKVIAIDLASKDARIPPPPPGAEVYFKLRHGGAAGRYAVVLKVNGYNTAKKQRLPADQCAAWILEPGCVTEVRGFQLDEHNRDDFASLSDHESMEQYHLYGAEAGQINVVVFKEKSFETVSVEKPQVAQTLPAEQNGGPPDLSGPPAGVPGIPVPDSDEQIESDTAIRGAALPKKAEKDLATLKSKLLLGKEKHRGLIVSGGQSDSKVNYVTFERDYNPIESITILYYTRPGL